MSYDNLVSLGIVRDADSNPKGAFQSVCSALLNAELPVPTAPLQPTRTLPGITVMILPGSGRKGMLEDVCLTAINHDPAMVCVEAYFDCLIQNQVNAVGNLSKAKIQVFSAAKEAELRLAEAAEKGCWPWDHAAFDPIKDFLRQIAG